VLLYLSSKGSGGGEVDPSRPGCRISEELMTLVKVFCVKYLRIEDRMTFFFMDLGDAMPSPSLFTSTSFLAGTRGGVGSPGLGAFASSRRHGSLRVMSAPVLTFAASKLLRTHTEVSVCVMLVCRRFSLLRFGGSMLRQIMPH
jgi:hypothetical protein